MVEQSFSDRIVGSAKRVLGQAGLRGAQWASTAFRAAGKKILVALAPPLAVMFALTMVVLFFAGAVSSLLLETSRAKAFDGNPANPLNAQVQARYEAAARAVLPKEQELQPFSVPWELLAVLDMARGIPLEEIKPEETARMFSVRATYATLERIVRTQVYRNGVLASDTASSETVRVLDTVENWEGIHRMQYTMQTRTEESTHTETVEDPVTKQVVKVTVRTVRTITEPVQAGWMSDRNYGQLLAVMEDLGLPDDDLFVLLAMYHAMMGEEEEFALPGGGGDGAATPPVVTPPVVNLPQSPEGWMWPVKSTRITSQFGMRFHPIKNRWKLHAGVDIGVAYEPVYAARSGVVLRVANDPDGYGTYVDIQHDQGYMTRYAHLSRGRVYVLPGQRVQAGQLLAISGNTGASTGPHLHFEIRLHGAPLDPLLFYPDLR